MYLSFSLSGVCNSQVSRCYREPTGMRLHCIAMHLTLTLTRGECSPGTEVRKTVTRLTCRLAARTLSPPARTGTERIDSAGEANMKPLKKGGVRKKKKPTRKPKFWGHLFGPKHRQTTLSPSKALVT